MKRSTAEVTSDPDGTRGRGDLDSSASLGGALDRLDKGCGVLVTGDVPTDAHRVAAARYFGAASNPRRRVLGLTTAPDRSDAWFPGEITARSQHTSVVSLEEDARGGADHGTPETGGAFAARLLDAVETVAGGEPLGALELRVGVFRVDELREALGSEQSAETLREIAAATRERAGMAHFHLPHPVEDDPLADPVVEAVAAGLGTQLDVVVQLRLREGTALPEERWHILGWGRTDWQPLR